LFSFLRAESAKLFLIASGIESSAQMRIPTKIASEINTASDDVRCHTINVTVTGKIFCRAKITATAPIISPRISDMNMMR
jgi:hypothetical protein